MDITLGLTWLLAGAVIGLVVGLLVGQAQAKRTLNKARLAMADSQQRRALERLREQNLELMSQLEGTNQRQTRTVESLKQTHASEMAAVEDELRNARLKLTMLMDAASQGHVISGSAFEPTQFDETP